jgi:hypothetical protein
MRKSLTALLLLAALMMTGCCTVDASNVAAQRATFDALAPDLRAYYEADVTLPDAIRALNLTTVDMWEQFVIVQEAEVAASE